MTDTQAYDRARCTPSREEIARREEERRRQAYHAAQVAEMKRQAEEVRQRELEEARVERERQRAIEERLAEEQAKAAELQRRSKRADMFMGMAHNLEKAKKVPAAVEFYERVVTDFSDLSQAKDAIARLRVLSPKSTVLIPRIKPDGDCCDSSKEQEKVVTPKPEPVATSSGNFPRYRKKWMRQDWSLLDRAIVSGVNQAIRNDAITQAAIVRSHFANRAAVMGYRGR